VPGFVYLGQAAKDDQWALYRRDGDPVLRDKQQRPGKKSSPGPASTQDWDAREQQARKRLTGERLTALAEHLQVPAAAIARLRPGIECVTWGDDPHDRIPSYSWPMVDGAGRCCGLHARNPRTGAKKAVHGASLGAFAPDGWQKTEGELLLPEGPSDVAAALAMGLTALGRPSNTAGAQALADLLSGTERPIVVLGEMDPKDDGKWPGRDGALATAKRLAAALRRPVEWAFPPDRAKDLRKWFHAQGLNHLSGADDCHAAGERFLAGLKRMPVRPPEGGEEGPELIASVEDIPTLADARAAGAMKKWAWEGWLQADVLNGLSGEFGSGKTRLVAELIRRVRAGEPWPDGQPMTLPPDSRFLFIPADYQHSELIDLAHKYGSPEECVFINAMKDNPDGVDLFDSPRAVACLERRIELLRPALCIVGPITGTTTERSHGRAEDGTAIYGPLLRMARKYGTTFVVLIHLNREGGTYGRHAKGKFRTELKLTKVSTEAGPERYRLEVAKSNSKAPAALGATQHDDRWEFDTSPPEIEPPTPGKRGPKPKVAEEAKRFIRKALAGGERKVCEVVDEWEKSGKSKRDVFAAAKELVETGELSQGTAPSPRGRKELKTWRLEGGPPAPTSGAPAGDVPF
jgi:hypothetical protein